MLYVASVGEPRSVYGWSEKVFDKIGVMNTDTGTITNYTNAELYRFLRGIPNSRPVVYGTYVYGKSQHEMYVFATPLTILKRIDKRELEQLLNNWANKHNKWSAYPVADYMAMCQVGSYIELAYMDRDTAGRTFTGSVKLKKTALDIWYFEDTNCVSSGQYFDSATAVDYLDYAWCGTPRHSLSVV